ncbi:MAG TPA: TonB-dependent receptor, partial [Bacteroidales bacterium]|nr:TonB-dependent receptor [Bacteroidales bacterium]
MFVSVTVVLGQGTVTGKVIDSDNDEALVGATVYLKGMTRGTITETDGTFMLAVPAGQQTVIVSFIGYDDQTFDVNIPSGQTKDIGTIMMKMNTVGLADVNVIASVATDRSTPVAKSSIKGLTVESLVGNQEYPEILRKTPSVYVTKQGGGFGDSRINVRGFDQRNVAVMINGIPVNDMENGWVYWSNWAGLADMTGQIQVQRGLGASKLAVASVGGSINIITKASETKEGGALKLTYGNDNYMKAAFVYSTGLKDNGLAFTFQLSHTRGNGYVDGTMFRAYSYFASLSKVFNDKHTLTLTGLGAPQWHHQRSIGSYDGVTLRTFVDPDNTDDPYTDMGIRFNHLWGYLDGEEFTWRRNFYHKPKFFLNHYWDMSDKTSLKTSAYISLGRGGGTGPRGKINGQYDTDWDFRYNDSQYADKGAVRFDDIVRWNSGGSVPDFGADKQTWEDYNIGDPPDNRRGHFADKYVSTSGYGFIRRASMNSHNWMGVLSTLTHKISENFNLVAGIDYRYYKGMHYRRVNKLLGSDAYYETDNYNNAGIFVSQEKPAGAIVEMQNDTEIDYYNDGLVKWFGFFGQLEYSAEKLSAFVSLSGSNQGFKRIDYFNYVQSDDLQAQLSSNGQTMESDWENHLGGTIKAGLNYNINDKHNIFLNGGFFSRQPIFDNVFINYVNQVNEDVVNQKVFALEAGYGFRTASVDLDVNLYRTVWTDRQFDRGVDLANGNDGLALFSGVGEVHQGVELEFNILPT